MPYFDHNATTPLAPIAREVWLKAQDEAWQNPSSLYRDAAKAKIRLDGARERIAEYFGADPKAIVFNSGATEGAHTVMAYLAAKSAPTARLLVSRGEHPCVRAAAERWFGPRIEWVNTNGEGVVDLGEIERALRAGGVAAVVVMAANNETGVLQPWERVAGLCRAASTPYLCDASQWLGKLPAAGFGEVDWVIGAAHKFGGPKGVGILKCAPQANDFQAFGGGEQEGGHRSGTENVAGAWASAAALGEAEQKKVFLEMERLALRREFELSLAAAVPGVGIVGANTDRLWNTVMAIMPAGENHRWVTKLDKLGFQVSAGSACASGKTAASPVLTAMGFSDEEAKRAVRFSSGWETTREDWQALATAVGEVAKSFAAEPSAVVKA